MQLPGSRRPLLVPLAAAARDRALDAGRVPAARMGAHAIAQAAERPVYAGQMGHTLHGEMPRAGDVPQKPCVWCAAPTDLRFIPEAMPELGPQPLHLFCAGDLILTFEALTARRRLKARQVERLAHFRALLLETSGQAHAATTALQRPQVNE